MQACLARLYVDEPFRRLFYRDAATLDEYRLTSEEAAAIRGIDRNALEYFAISLKNKRRTRVERAYPLLFSLDPDEMLRYYSRYYHLYMAKPRDTGNAAILNFGLFMEEALADAPHLPAYARDVAKYERLFYSVELAPLSEDAPDAAPPAPPMHVRVTSLDSRPSLRRGIRVADFGHDIGELEECLHRGESIASLRLTPRHCCVVFRPATATSVAKVLRVNAPTRAVLDRCDGDRSVRDIVADTEAALGAADLERGIVETIDRLLGLEVLALDVAPAMRAAAAEPAYGASSTEGM
jgi:hypothetical protein